MIARSFFVGSGLLSLVLGFRLGARGTLMGWLGLSLLVIGIAYVLQRPRLLGKRPDGSFHLLGLLVHAPFLGAAWVAWQLRRSRTRTATLAAAVMIERGLAADAG